MQDNPPPPLIIEEVSKALQEGLAAGFPQKVAANALSIAQRELVDGPRTDEAESERLSRLVGHEGDLAARNARLASMLAAGEIALCDELVGHLIATTIEKIEKDQPGYPSFRAWRGA